MISPTQMLDELMRMDRLNLGAFKAAAAEDWCLALNEALPEVTQAQVAQALRKLATVRTTEIRGAFLLPGDLVAAITHESSLERRARTARLESAKHTHGDFTTHPSITETAEFLRFKQTTTAAFLEGSTVEQARAAGWAAIGRTEPPAELTEHHEIPGQVLGVMP